MEWSLVPLLDDFCRLWTNAKGSKCLMLHIQARKAVAHEVEQLHASRARLVIQLQALTKAVSVCC